MNIGEQSAKQITHPSVKRRMWRRTHTTASKERNTVEAASHYGCSYPSFSRSVRYGYANDFPDRGKTKLNKKPLKLAASIVDEKAPVYRVGDLIKSHRTLCVIDSYLPV